MPELRVVDPNPTVARSVASANVGDYARFGFWSVFGVGLGYATARPAIPRIQFVNTIAGGIIGGLGGFIIMAMRSEQRLMGKRE